MTWKEFKELEYPSNQWVFPKRELTTITCPDCGQYIYKRLDIVCTSVPPQNRYECECGWVGFSTK